LTVQAAKATTASDRLAARSDGAGSAIGISARE
jgi:hypothetical protein